MINDTMSEYLANSGLGSGTLKNIMLSPADFYFSQKRKEKESAAQSKGTLWHSYILERDLYHAENMIQPEDWGSLVKSPGRQKWDDFKKKAKNAGKNPVKWSDGQELLLLDEVIKDHKPLQGILETHHAELSFYAEHEGVLLKSREDLFCESQGTIWDVKTTSKPVDDDSLGKIIYDHGYHFSAAHHMKCVELCGFEVNSFGWIFVSTATPCPHIVVRKASREVLEAGKNDWKYAFEMYRSCKEKDSWPGYDEEIREISFPEWIERKY